MKKVKAKENVKASTKAKVTYAPFEVADYLDSEGAIAEYLSLAARDENPGVLLKALGDVAEARGMKQCHRNSSFFGSLWLREFLATDSIQVNCRMFCAQPCVNRGERYLVPRHRDSRSVLGFSNEAIKTEKPRILAPRAMSAKLGPRAREGGHHDGVAHSRSHPTVR